MIEATVDHPKYGRFFEEQRRKIDALDKWRRVVLIAVVVVLFALLVSLESPAGVWLYVAVLFAIAYYGLHRLHLVTRVTRAALTDLEEIGEFLGTPRSRDQAIECIKKKVKPDESNVPEALAAFCAGQRTGEGVRAAANAAFAQPSSELGVAGFLRTALVLGGLFGTVLFFAVELRGSGLLEGDLAELLPGLRGALASTLTGILGSIAIGALGSKADQIVERSIWETESLIGGPLSRALASEEATPDVLNEVQLWQLLLHEVAQLRRETATEYAKLREDVSAHAMALQTLSTQLTELPQVQVPPQLSRLQDVVSEFAVGTRLLHETSKGLIEAVGTLGIFAPAQTLRELEAIRTGAEKSQRATEGLVQDVRREVMGVRGEASALRQSLGQMAETVGECKEAVITHDDRVRRGLSTIATSAERLEQGATQARETLAHLRVKVDRADDMIQSLSSASSEPDAAENYRREGGPQTNFRAGVQRIAESAAAAERAAVAARDLEGTVRNHADQLAVALAKLSSQQESLVRIGARLASMEKVIQWHERASRAPLMRLLLLSFWPARAARQGDGT